MKFLIVLTILFFGARVFGKNLSEVALFTRCYTHLTQNFPNKNLQLMKDVKAGNITAVAACSNLLDSVSFSASGNTLLPDPNDSTAINIVRVFHNLHYSWFSTRFYPEIEDTYIRNTGNIYDASSPALYLTRALFVPDAKYQEIFQGDTTYRAKRVVDEKPLSLVYPFHTAANDSLQGVKFAGSGNLIGIEPQVKNLAHNVLSWNNNPAEDATAVRVAGAPIVINTHWGGGVIGSQIYMMQNVQAAALNHRTDGGVNVNRKWARSVLSDFFCRKLPVVRDSDVGHYVDTSSALTYRNSKGCVKCHASADTMAGLVRNTKYDRRSSFFDNGGSYAFITKWTPTKTVASYFPTATDSNYYLRPTNGSFYYRTYQGDLIFKEMTSVETLAEEFLKLDDMYVCTAKRYFEYFTGINADISDIQDPENPNFPKLSVQQKKYRDIVVNLGKALKEHQDIKTLIKSIIESPVYKSNDFLVSE